MKTSTSITKIASALLLAQKKMETVIKGDKNPFFGSKYADINSFLEVAVPTLNEVGVVLLQPAGSDGNGYFVETRLIHGESGEFIEAEPLRLVLNKNDMQNVGACITYARRFLLQSVMGMQAEDDDGETAVGRGKTFTKPAAATPTQVLKTTSTPTSGSLTLTSPAASAIVATVSLPPGAVQSSPSPTATPKQEAVAPVTPTVPTEVKKNTFRKPSTVKSTNSNPFGS